MKLEIYVAQPFEEMKARSLEQVRRINANEMVEAICGVGFETLSQFSGVFTPKRWELVEPLQE